MTGNGLKVQMYKEVKMHFYHSPLHNRSVANVTSYLLCFTGSQNTNCTRGCWKIRKWAGRTDSVCLQWHRSGEHQLHFHGSRKHRNSQGISQLNSVWGLKEQLISSAPSFFPQSACVAAWNTWCSVCCLTLPKDSRHPRGAFCSMSVCHGERK